MQSIKKNLCSAALVSLALSLQAAPNIKLNNKKTKSITSQKQHAPRTAPLAIKNSQDLERVLKTAHQKNQALFIKIYKDTCPYCLKVHESFNALAKKYNKQVLFATVDGAQEWGKEFMNALSINVVPSWIAIAPEETKASKKPLETIAKNGQITSGSGTQEEIEQKIVPLLKNKPKTIPAQSSATRIIKNNKELTQALKDAHKNKKGLCLKVYTDGCPACKSVTESFDTLAKKHQQKAIFAQVNASEEGNKRLIETLEITGVPSWVAVAPKKTLVKKEATAHLKEHATITSGAGPEKEIEQKLAVALK